MWLSAKPGATKWRVMSVELPLHVNHCYDCAHYPEMCGLIVGGFQYAVLIDGSHCYGYSKWLRHEKLMVAAYLRSVVPQLELRLSCLQPAQG